MNDRRNRHILVVEDNRMNRLKLALAWKPKVTG